ncbi:nuclear transport factor 2 family protein [Mameliella sp. AT18]|uniref:nuclear transport factor 2 family protein n=1 Tax=Mameliella sp. AT18 TaxID=3028385 RepID=UPI000841220D|nr:nuclear transport factor 2 family protein [Mameliella sp. AT18]MDD9730691.1 nuclear transport factor 2 family protein [Mameliella sp. AT18]ODM48883.1 polyketide cyclase [Ruegeria sp. PBVC088]
MRGFDPKWQDVPHFIIGITKEIWEDREIGSLRHRYAPGLIVRSPASVVVDNSNVIAATMATLAEFPDRELLGEDVIWCEDPEGATETSDAFLSSHRLICTATHSHPGMYGTPTGRRVTYRILADCAIRDDAVYDEWLVRDQSAIVAQMGFDVVDWTRDLIAREGGPETCVPPMTPATDVAGPYDRKGNENEWGQRYADVISAIMAADMNVIPRAYDRGVNLHYPGGQDGLGWGDADRFWMGLRAAFPMATFKIEHVVGRQDPLMPPRAAVRWSLHGRHSGWGRFGRPTGAEVYIMGISHADFGPYAGSGTWGEPTIRREFTLIDETAIWKQILLQTGAHE